MASFYENDPEDNPAEEEEEEPQAIEELPVRPPEPDPKPQPKSKSRDVFSSRYMS